MAFCQTIFRSKTLFFICLFVLILVLLLLKKLHFVMSIQMSTEQLSLSRLEHAVKPSCKNVLGNMVLGHWLKDKLKDTEIAAVNNFHKKIRSYYGIPQTLQREDNRCGNLGIVGTGHRGIGMFRALCDPNGSTPCCFKNKCMLQEQENCRCRDCYDLRQKLHAELSTWVPANSTCKITTFVRGEDVCNVLKRLTIYFFGDSFMRQMYIALLSLLRKNKPYGPLFNNTLPDKVQHCDRYYAQVSECSPWIIKDASECDNTMHLKFVSFWKVTQINETLSYIEELQRQADSIIVIGTGLHQQFNLPVVENEILNPLFLTLAKSHWPKPIWLSPHSPGLLKHPGYRTQQKDITVRFALRVNDIMKTRGIPVLDFFQMTEHVMSYDGTHYGIGINDLKVQVLLNYILELRTNA